jgi:hypothetical protein
VFIYEISTVEFDEPWVAVEDLSEKYKRATHVRRIKVDIKGY